MQSDFGEPLRVVATKWGERPHWEFDAARLGTDEHGTWAGVPVGSVIVRPGARVVTEQLQVVLFPQAGFVATFHEASGPIPWEVYVDISTVPVLTPGVVTSVDLDLDVLRGVTGRVWVEDEDEFADHRKRWQYPDAVVSQALATCESVAVDLAARRAPFDGVHLGWLDTMRRHVA